MWSNVVIQEVWSKGGLQQAWSNVVLQEVWSNGGLQQAWSNVVLQEVCSECLYESCGLT